MKRIHCFIHGHNYPWSHYGENRCERCGHEYEYAEPIGILGEIAYSWRWGRLGAVRHWLSWFRKCEDCGKRFHRHDDSIEHLPF